MALGRKHNATAAYIGSIGLVKPIVIATAPN